MTIHKPVLHAEVIELLNLQPGDNAIDCTLGGGGHATAMLESVAPDGKVLAIDADTSAIERLKIKDKDNLTLVNDNFRNLSEIIHESGFRHPISAVLLDLGLSSDQLEQKSRGFSFQKDAPLDMRYHKKHRKHESTENTGELTADEIINKWPRGELEKIFRIYGEEKKARTIAKTIAEERKRQPIKTTKELVRLISGSSGAGRGRIHPATKVFQALRIAVNDELESLREVLPQAVDLLEAGGRLAVIAFHGLEDKIVKNFFKEQDRAGKSKTLTKKPVVSSKEEVINNPRSRSAKLRVVKKI